MEEVRGRIGLPGPEYYFIGLTFPTTGFGSLHGLRGYIVFNCFFSSLRVPVIRIFFTYFIL